MNEREYFGSKSLAAQCREIATAAMKEGIFQAALQVIRERGFDGLTMDRVAEVAGVAKGSIYHYFATKQALMEFIFERVVSPALERAKEVALSALSPVEKLRAILVEWFTHFSAYRGIFETIFADPTIRHFCSDARRSKYSDGIAIFETVIREGMEQGIFRVVHTQVAAEVMVGALVLPVERDLESGRTRSTEAWAEKLLDLLLWGLASPELAQHSSKDASITRARPAEETNNVAPKGA